MMGRALYAILLVGNTRVMIMSALCEENTRTCEYTAEEIIRYKYLGRAWRPYHCLNSLLCYRCVGSELTTRSTILTLKIHYISSTHLLETSSSIKTPPTLFPLFSSSSLTSLPPASFFPASSLLLYSPIGHCSRPQNSKKNLNKAGLLLTRFQS